MWNWIKKNDYWFALIGAFECLGISSLEIFDKSLLTISNKGLFSLFLIGYILFCVLFAYFSLNFWKGIKWTDWLSEDPVRYYSLFAVLALFIIIPIGIAAGINYKEDVVVELHGLIADLIVFGVLLALYDFFRQRSSDIKRYLREIDHYGGWEEKEATYRIIGLLRHLSNLKYKGVKLYKAYLKDAVLNDSIGYHTTVPVHGVSGGIIFRAVDLREATILKSNFENADANGINFQGAQLIESSFREIDATKSNMSEITISNCSFFINNLS